MTALFPSGLSNTGHKLGIETEVNLLFAMTTTCRPENFKGTEKWALMNIVFNTVTLVPSGAHLCLRIEERTIAGSCVWDEGNDEE